MVMIMKEILIFLLEKYVKPPRKLINEILGNMFRPNEKRRKTHSLKKVNIPVIDSNADIASAMASKVLVVND